MEGRFLERFGRLAIELICGPEVVGTVELVKKDYNNPKFWHVLVLTEQGEPKHIIWRDRSTTITSNDLNRNSEMPWRRGDRFRANMRGNGILFEGPGAIKLEEDPFNLKQNNST